MIVDCAHNTFLSKELVSFLAEQDIPAKAKANALVVTDKKISGKMLESFLRETGRKKHKVIPYDSDTIILAIQKSLEDIGLESCEFCGYTAHKELVEVHRRTHQGI